VGFPSVRNPRLNQNMDKPPWRGNRVIFGVGA
jgi:hypothetical protein